MSALSNLAINDSGFAFNPATGDCFVLNDTTVDIINLLKQDLDVSAISEEMAEIYDIEPKEVYADIVDAISKFELYGLL